jgi:CDGSH-type Zn-finger protein
MLVGITEGKAFARCACGYTISNPFPDGGNIKAAVEAIEAEAKENHRCNLGG